MAKPTPKAQTSVPAPLAPASGAAPAGVIQALVPSRQSRPEPGPRLRRAQASAPALAWQRPPPPRPSGRQVSKHLARPAPRLSAHRQSRARPPSGASECQAAPRWFLPIPATVRSWRPIHPRGDSARSLCRDRPAPARSAAQQYHPHAERMEAHPVRQRAIRLLSTHAVAIRDCAPFGPIGATASFRPWQVLHWFLFGTA